MGKYDEKVNEVVDLVCKYVDGKIDSIPETDLAGYAKTEDIRKDYVAKETGKSLISDTEITRLAGVTNYDDTNIVSDIATIKAIAEGKNRAKVFATKEAMVAWLADPDNVKTLQIGDNMYIQAVDTPDYWWDGTTVCELEIEKVDLTGYAKTEDIPSLEGYAKTEDIPSLEGYAKTEDIPSLEGYAKTEDIPELPDLSGYFSKNGGKIDGDLDVTGSIAVDTIESNADSKITLNDNVDIKGNLKVVGGFEMDGDHAMKAIEFVAKGGDFIITDDGETAHKLSEKANLSDIPDLSDYAKNTDIDKIWMADCYITNQAEFDAFLTSTTNYGIVYIKGGTYDYTARKSITNTRCNRLIGYAGDVIIKVPFGAFTTSYIIDKVPVVENITLELTSVSNSTSSRVAVNGGVCKNVKVVAKECSAALNGKDSIYLTGFSSSNCESCSVEFDFPIDIAGTDWSNRAEIHLFGFSSCTYLTKCKSDIKPKHGDSTDQNQYYKNYIACFYNCEYMSQADGYLHPFYFDTIIDYNDDDDDDDYGEYDEYYGCYAVVVKSCQKITSSKFTRDASSKRTDYMNRAYVLLDCSFISGCEIRISSGAYDEDGASVMLAGMYNCHDISACRLYIDFCWDSAVIYGYAYGMLSCYNISSVNVTMEIDDSEQYNYVVGFYDCYRISDTTSRIVNDCMDSSGSTGYRLSEHCYNYCHEVSNSVACITAEDTDDMEVAATYGTLCGFTNSTGVRHCLVQFDSGLADAEGSPYYNSASSSTWNSTYACSNTQNGGWCKTEYGDYYH